MQTILVPVDFSAHTTHTAHFGMELAHQIGGQVLLLHIVQPSPRAPMMGVPTVNLSSWNREMYNEKSVEMQQVIDELNDYKVQEEFWDVDIQSQLLVGQPADSILEIARSHQAAFIVMGTVGAAGAWEKMFGSVTSEVARQADQPLWILPNAVQLDTLQQFAYFADLEGDEVSCINQVIDLGEQLRVAMNVVHVSGPNEDSQSQAGAMINAFEVSYANDRITFQNLGHDSVAEGVEAYTRTHWPDAIVLAQRNRGLVGRLFHKSVIRQLSLTAKRPLLIIQKPAL